MDIVETLSDVGRVFLLLTKENVVIGRSCGYVSWCSDNVFNSLEIFRAGVPQRDAERRAATFEYWCDRNYQAAFIWGAASN